jgi:glycosyltransferase involved in cell wall biosynthesis
MKVIIDHHSPFILAHGGFQIQIEQTYQALRSIGVDAELMRWWDDTQKPDVIHFFGKPSTGYLRRAKSKGIATVVSELHTGLGSHSQVKKHIQSRVIKFAKQFFPPLASRLNWDSYDHADAVIALTPYEAGLMENIFHADPKRMHVVPNGVDDAFLQNASLKREDWLLCTATITERKRVNELAKAATLAGLKLRVLGRPYSETDPYFLSFLQIAANSHGLVEWHGEVTDRGSLADYYRRARAFVLPSTMESQSLSALEAAACKCSLILTDLPWARTTFGPSAIYLPDTGDSDALAPALSKALAQSATNPPPRVLSWVEVADRLNGIYNTLG